MTATATNISIQTGTFVSWGPVLKALLLALVASLFAWYAAGQNDFDSGSIYSGVFDLLSIFTGFLATFYVFVVTKGNEFLHKIQGTETYSMVLRLLKFTILWSAATIFASYILMVVNLTNYELFSAAHFSIFLWIANVALIAINFARCASHFSTILSASKG